MDPYSEIMHFSAASPEEAGIMIRADILPALITIWLAEYRAGTADAEIVEVETDGFRNLFDLTEERLITAYGFSATTASGGRDTSRMRGFPKPPGGRIKGHAIAHQLGGGLDINLVPQNRAINGGAFRVLEREAVRHPGCLYFSNWIYDQPVVQTPAMVVQGLIRARDDDDPQRQLAPGENALIVKIVRHAN